MKYTTKHPLGLLSWNGSLLFSWKYSVLQCIVMGAGYRVLREIEGELFSKSCTGHGEIYPKLSPEWDCLGGFSQMQMDSGFLL